MYIDALCVLSRQSSQLHAKADLLFVSHARRSNELIPNYYHSRKQNIES